MNALSIMGLLMLGGGKGGVLDIVGVAGEAVPAVPALADLVERKFDEDQ